MFSETIVIQAVINGIVIGSLYLLMAIGFTVVFGLMRIVNFSHAEFYMLGAFVCYVGIAWLKLPFVLVVIAAFLLALAFGSLLELSVLKRMRGDEFSGMIATIGIGMILQSTALILFGPDPLAVPSIAKGMIRIGGVVLPKARIYAGLFSIFVLMAMYVFFHHTQHGRALRAVVQDREAAQIQGMDTRWYYPLGFGIGVGLAALAGALMAPIFSVYPTVGFGPMVKSFIVVIVGGLGSIPGAAIAAFILGISESMSGTFLKSSYAEMFLFVFVMALLILRPQGLFGEKS
uniref:branched-chain amino acid ABC transporter permease n=1 Tax=Castellaniella defragrans TaxID=75697 RepID=UPI0033419FFB